jgi:deferrochelatase/peroxidase EfeB
MSEGKDQDSRPGFTRRRLIAGAALVGAGAGLDHVLSGSMHGAAAASSSADSKEDFYGVHQAGIATPAQDYLYFAAFDVTSDAVDDLRGVLEEWTTAAARMAAGEPYEAVVQVLDEPPVDTGEAVGLGSSLLTITIGLGPTLFGSGGADRFGLASLRPPELANLPSFQGEDLVPESSGGDLCVQACANDPQVAFHTVHVLSRIASSAATLRWTQQGFGRTSSTSRSQQTPRNLMGFKDGTDNIRAEETDAMTDLVVLW